MRYCERCGGTAEAGCIACAGGWAAGGGIVAEYVVSVFYVIANMI